MTKILVKKSAPKGILVKQIQPQLMQMPTGGKSLKDFVRVLRTPTRTQDTPGVSRRAKVAAGLGVLGKIGAGLSTANQTIQSMQGGNLSAPLSAGYTFEAADPTGRMISEAADPSLSYAPAKQKLSRKPPAKFSVGAALGDIARGPVGKPVILPDGRVVSADDPILTMPIGGSAYQPMDYSNTPHMQNVKAGMSLPQADRVLMQGQPAGPIQPVRPVTQPPVQVPNTAVPSNVTIEPVGGVNRSQPPGYPGEEIEQVPLPGQEPPATPVKTQQQILQEANQTLMGQQAQPMQPTTAPQPAAPQPVAPQPVAPQPVAPQSAGPQQTSLQQFYPPQEQTQQGVSPTFYQQQNKSFVTALTEKLGADIVYKMTPHQIGTFAAYTLLKLR